MDRLLILGAGGYGKTVAEAAEQSGAFGEIAFLDDAAPGVLGKCEGYAAFAGRFSHAYAAFGNNALRAVWLDRLEQAGFALPVIVHPRAYVSPSAQMSPGAVVLALAAVGASAVLERGVIVNMGAIVDHDARVEACAHIAPGAIVKASVHVDPQIKLESGTVAVRPE